MPTSSEQKALTFVAIVVLLGGAVRVLKASSSSNAPTTIEQQALARQATAADSAAAKAHSPKGAKRGKSVAKGDTLPRMTGVSASSAAAGGSAFAGSAAPVLRPGFPPPNPRIDINSGIQQPTAPVSAAAASGRKTTGKPIVAGPIDLDAATTEEIEALPHVGPVLARKIVANRDSLGPFGSLVGLRRVKGVGEATAKNLAPLVTFGQKGGMQGVRP